jgi:hypothetical protein
MLAINRLSAPLRRFSRTQLAFCALFLYRFDDLRVANFHNIFIIAFLGYPALTPHDCSAANGGIIAGQQLKIYMKRPCYHRSAQK